MKKCSVAPYNLRKQWSDEAGNLPEDIIMRRASGEVICEFCGRLYRKHPQDWRTAYASNDFCPWLVILCDGTLGKL